MKKRIFNAVNLLLGAVVVLLAGCKTQKVAVNQEPPQPDQSPKQLEVRQQEPIMCLYGVPPEVYRRQQEREQAELDSIKNQQRPQRDSIPMPIRKK